MRWMLVAFATCTVAAIVLLALKGSQLMNAIAIVLGGTAFVLIISVSFYAIGRSEDRERERVADADAARSAADTPS